jgi:hypothetical protein
MTRAKKLPSTVAFQFARIFARQLHRELGPKLKCVFLTGSAAGGMALRDSDVDMVVVRDLQQEYRSMIPFSEYPETKIGNRLSEQFGIKYHAISVPPSEVMNMGPDYRSHHRMYRLALNMLQKWGLPVFVGKGAEKLVQKVPAPTAEKVLQYYDFKVSADNLKKRVKQRKKWLRAPAQKPFRPVRAQQRKSI